MIIFVAYVLKNREDTQITNRRISALKKYFNDIKLDNSYWMSGQLGLFIAERKFTNLNYAFISSQENIISFTSHLPYGASSVISIPKEVKSTATKLTNALIKNPMLYSFINPPLITGRFDINNPRIDLWCDALRHGRLYRHETRELIVYSNRPTAAAIFSGEMPELSRFGWVGNFASGSFYSGSSPYKEIQHVEAGEHVVMNSSGERRIKNPLFDDWLSNPEKYGDWRAKMRQMVIDLKTFVNYEKIEVALSGGRDSRGAAALIASMDLKRTRFRTNVPANLEALLAMQCIRRLRGFKGFYRKGIKLPPAPLDEVTRHSKGLGSPWPTDTTGISELIGKFKDDTVWRVSDKRLNVSMISTVETARRWVRLSDGSALSTAIGVPVPQQVDEFFFASTDQYTPSVAGDGAETGKPYKYIDGRVAYKTPALQSRALAEIQKTHVWERMKEHPLSSLKTEGYASEQGGEIISILQSMRSEIDVVNKYNLPEYYTLNLIFLRHRYPQGNQYGIGSTVFLPYSCPAYQIACLKKPISAMLKAEMMDEVVEAFQPKWSARRQSGLRSFMYPPPVPFFDDLIGPGYRELKKTLGQGTFVFSDPFNEEINNVLDELGDYHNFINLKKFRENLNNCNNISYLEQIQLHIKLCSLLHYHAFLKVRCNAKDIIKDF